MLAIGQYTYVIYIYVIYIYDCILFRVHASIINIASVEISSDC